LRNWIINIKQKNKKTKTGKQDKTSVKSKKLTKSFREIKYGQN